MISHRLFCFSQNIEPNTQNRSLIKLVAESGFLNPHLFIQSEIPLFLSGKTTELNNRFLVPNNVLISKTVVYGLSTMDFF